MKRQLLDLRDLGYDTLLLLRYRNLQFYDAPREAMAASIRKSHLPTIRSDLESMTRSALCSAGRLQLWSKVDDGATMANHGAVSVALHLSSQFIHVWHLKRLSESYGKNASNMSALLGSLLLFGVELQENSSALEQTQAANQMSDREVTVLKWIRRGKTYPEIALILGISAKTVEFHMSNAMRKLGVNDKLSAILAAVKLGIVEL